MTSTALEELSQASSDLNLGEGSIPSSKTSGIASSHASLPVDSPGTYKGMQVVKSQPPMTGLEGGGLFNVKFNRIPEDLLQAFVVFVLPGGSFRIVEVDKKGDEFVGRIPEHYS